MRASVVIPAYNAADTLAAAIDSALAQGGVEVIVIDDGSSDLTWRVLMAYSGRIRAYQIEHRGPSAARNFGIEQAHGEFVQFLDADDTLEAGKIDAQLAVLDESVGWVICDTMILQGGSVELASVRYDYAGKNLGGWLQPLLTAANFIPIHAPLVRRSVIGDIRFEDRELEDWHFWHAIAGVARCRYLDQPLCTYRKRAGSRNAGTKRDPLTAPGIVPPLRLNLGAGTPGTRSWHPIPGMLNLDRSLGWRFEDGLGQFADGSVAGITVSHSLMYVARNRWQAVFDEFARVLQTGGVVRITEDDATNPESSRLGGWRGSEPAVTVTDAVMTRRYLENAGFTVYDCGRDQTHFPDRSLLQAQHGEPPDVFWIEGVRESCVLFSPHQDDECLFAGFTLIRHKPRVVICYASVGDYGTTAERLAESAAAARLLGAGPVEQWRGGDLVAQMQEFARRVHPTRVWAPGPDASHPDHVAVSLAAQFVFGERVWQYQTYNAAGKVREGTPVPFEDGWAERKQRALTCYATQLDHPRARQFFEWPIDEWLVE